MYHMKMRFASLTIIFCVIFCMENTMAKEITSEATSEAIPETTTEIVPEPTTEMISETTTEAETVTKKTTSKYVVSKLSPAKSKIIVLDPGHCKNHKGAHYNGVKEEKAVLIIAKACQNILNQFGDVTVYLTRSTSGCCKALRLGDCLIARNRLAKRLSADALISFHLNADDNTKKQGALILPAYYSGYNNEIAAETQALGKVFLDELSILGLKNKGFLLRKSSIPRYPNGAYSDYYSIVRNGVRLKIPSLIVEHGFTTNISDVTNFFQTKSQLTNLGIADANAIITYYGLNQGTIDGYFAKKGSAKYFKIDKKTKVRGWVKYSGKWYYFNKSNSKMKKGFLKIGKKKYYLNPSTGELTIGWFNVNGKTYLAKGNGTIVKSQAYSDGLNTYLFSSTGRKFMKGWHKIKNKKYYVKNGIVIDIKRIK